MKFASSSDDIKCYPDASLGINDNEGKSTTGYAIKIFDDLISWRTKKQTHVALLSAEAEFVATSVACRELANLCEICRQIIKLDTVPTIYEDNKAAIKLAKTKDSQTLKDMIHLCYHYVRFEVKSRNIQIKWISSQKQLETSL